MSSKEEDISAVDAASAALQDCLRAVEAGLAARGEIDGAQKMVGFLKQHDEGLLTAKDLSRIEIGLSIAEIQIET